MPSHPSRSRRAAGRRLVLVAGLAALLLLTGSGAARADGLRVAIYGEAGANGEELLAVARAVAAGGHLPLVVTDEDLAAGKLTRDRFDVFVLPEGEGGWSSFYEQNLGDGGLDGEIVAFVEAGGGFVGLGAGARYAAATERWDGTDYARMGLWDGVAEGPPGAVGGGMAEVAIEPAWEAGWAAGATRVVFAGYGAAWFDGGAGEVLARWRTGRPGDPEEGRAALVRFPRGAGRGVLFAFEPVLDVRSRGDWTAWDDRAAASYDGEHDLGLFLALLEWAAGGGDRRPADLVPAESPGRRIALYTTRRADAAGEEGGAYPGLLAAVARAVEYAGHQPLAIRDVEVCDGSLARAHWDGVIFPGGWAPGYVAQLSGCEQAIRDLVAAGGAYVGISAGAFYAADQVTWDGEPVDYPLDLYPGVLEGPLPDLPPWPGHALTPLLVDDPDPAIPSGRYVTWYQGESWYHEPLGAGVVVARYDHEGESHGRAAAIRHGYGAGRCVYPNLHLEMEEGDPRDWTFTGDEDDPDPESEWDLFASLLNWALAGAPADPPPRPSLGLPARFGELDGTGERLAEVQRDDARGDLAAGAVAGDGRLTVPPGAGFHLAGFGAKARAGVPEATLEVEYSAAAGYRGEGEVSWTTDGERWHPTGIVPLPGRIDEVATCDLHAAGLDTVEELRALAVRFVNDATEGDPVHFDFVRVRLAADGDADGAPDPLDCDPGAPGAWAPPRDPALAWEGKDRLAWDDEAASCGEGIVYDLAGGDLAELRADGGFDRANCRVLHVPEARVPDPPPGRGSWRLVRARNACGEAGWGARDEAPSCP